MILDNDMPERPEINYPTQWGFKLIGRDKEALLKCIKEAMGEKEHLCSLEMLQEQESSTATMLHVP